MAHHLDDALGGLFGEWTKYEAEVMNRVKGFDVEDRIDQMEKALYGGSPTRVHLTNALFGAAIGSIYMPGVGTLVGAGIGCAVSLFAGWFGYGPSALDTVDSLAPEALKGLTPEERRTFEAAWNAKHPVAPLRSALDSGLDGTEEHLAFNVLDRGGDNEVVEQSRTLKT